MRTALIVLGLALFISSTVVLVRWLCLWCARDWRATAQRLSADAWKLASLVRAAAAQSNVDAPVGSSPDDDVLHVLRSLIDELEAARAAVSEQEAQVRQAEDRGQHLLFEQARELEERVRVRETERDAARARVTELEQAQQAQTGRKGA